LEIRDESVRLERLNKIKKKYKESTEDIEYYEKEFESKIKDIIND
jgi:DNA repair ATPase RecN